LFALLLLDAEAGGGGGVAAAFIFFGGFVGGVFEVGRGGRDGGGGGLAFSTRIGDGVEGWRGGSGVVGIGQILLGWVGGLEGEGCCVCRSIEVENVVNLRKCVVACWY